MYNIVTVYIYIFFFYKYSVISIKNLKCILDSNNMQQSYRKNILSEYFMLQLIKSIFIKIKLIQEFKNLTTLNLKPFMLHIYLTFLKHIIKSFLWIFRDGTTDVTRTFHFGTPSKYEKVSFLKTEFYKVNNKL